MCAKYYELRCMFFEKFTSLMLARDRVKIGVIFGVRFERRKVDKKKQTYKKNETCKLYSRDF